MSSQSCLGQLGSALLGLLPGVGVAPALLSLGGVLLAERGGAEDFDLFLGGQLYAFAVCVHQFLHCFDGVLQPLGVLQQHLVLPRQVREHVGGRVVEQRADLLERQPGGPVHQDQVQPLDIGVGVVAVARRGAHARNHQADVVVVVQGAHRDTGEGGYRADGSGVHDATIDPDVG